MTARQSVFKTRREYNRWVGNQTLEDFALRFTAKKARKLSIAHVGQTALGATAFLALEALSAAATLQYGFVNTLFAMLAVAIAIILTGAPIAYHAARNGLDIDLLTRGAGFGYLGSTVTSLVYATFTFIFFAIEAAILASALQALFHIPLAIGYVICALVVLPIVTHGITAISRFQIGTQPLWLALQCTALIIVGYYEYSKIPEWVAYTPPEHPEGTSFNLALFGACSAIFFALIAQIGEQVDYLRFLPERTKTNQKCWWFWMIFSGPGWISIGLVKMLFGSFLAYLAILQLTSFEHAADPVYMYQMTFNYLTDSPTFALILAGVMVIISQMKINLTNAYAGSIAWSNFFSRLTHSHPGRVVWLVFNVAIALILIEMGAYKALEAIVGIFALIAISWLGCLSADLLINRPLGISPRKIEFKRSHLYDINPVGFGSMMIAISLGIIAYLGYFGDNAKHLAHYISLGSCYLFVPLIGWITKGKYYLARTDHLQSSHNIDAVTVYSCSVCENEFEQEDISHCPAYAGIICSLCCSLDARCQDMCKTNSGIIDQLNEWVSDLTAGKVTGMFESRISRFIVVFSSVVLINAAVLSLIFFHNAPSDEASRALVLNTVWTVFYVLTIVAGILSWLILLVQESQRIAQKESNRQTQLLVEEIEAHKKTDAALQSAKESAEAANEAKTRYLSGISHELRTPLQSVLGYAQLLQEREDTPAKHQRMLNVIRNSGEHLSNLIEGLLEISKIEAGRLDIYQNEVNLKELLNQLTAIFKPQAEAKGITFRLHLHNQLPARVKADEKRLKQILINLLSNAIKYTQSGHVDFHVYYRSQIAQFTVEDTGVGIHQHDLQRILDPFERLRDPNVTEVSSTGLGLTIVKLLTEVLGGNLDIKSTHGHGSSFTVSIMLSSIETPISNAVDERRISGYQGKRKTILVVDDEPTHKELITELLTPYGFTVLEAKNAEHCLSLLQNSTPDMMVLDINMPNVNGFELCRKLRSVGYQHPVLMVSANATELHKTDSEEYKNYDGYMTKPINTRELVEKVGGLLKLQWTYDTAPEIFETTKEETEEASYSYEITDTPELNSILEAAQIGHKRGIINMLDTLDSTGQLNSELTAHVRYLAESLQFKKIVKLLETGKKL